jgi:hypothetical protein
VQYRDVGFDIANVSKWRVALNGFRNEWGGIQPESTSYDMRFRAADLVTLGQNAFGTAANPNRVDILIDADTVVNGVAHGRHFLIDAHQFGDSTASFGASAIKISPSAVDIQIGASNQFVGQFSSTIVDDASGAAVTLAGYPGVPGDPAQPGVVAPSSADPAAGITTLGSANVAWPQSFTQGQYLPPPGTAPGNPVVGWVIYTDPSTGDLYARWQSGAAIRLLPHP